MVIILVFGAWLPSVDISAEATPVVPVETDDGSQSGVENSSGVTEEPIPEPIVASTAVTVDGEADVSIPEPATPSSEIPVLAGSDARTNPVATSTPWPRDSLACDVAGERTLVAGDVDETRCTYVASDPDAPVDITASVEMASGDGWLLEVEPVSAGGTGMGTSERGAMVIWSIAGPLAPGESFDIVIRVYVPFDAEPGQRATIAVTSGASGIELTWDVTVAVPGASLVEDQVVHSSSAGLTCSPHEAGQNGYLMSPGTTSVAFDCAIWSLASESDGVYLSSLTATGPGSPWVEVAMASGKQGVLLRPAIHDGSRFGFVPEPGPVFLAGGETGGSFRFQLVLRVELAGRQSCATATVTVQLVADLAVSQDGDALLRAGQASLAIPLVVESSGGSATVAFVNGPHIIGSFSGSGSIHPTVRATVAVTPPGCFDGDEVLLVNLSIVSSDGRFFDFSGGGVGGMPLSAATLVDIQGDGANVAFVRPGLPASLENGVTIGVIPDAGGGTAVLDIIVTIDVPVHLALPGAHAATLIVMIASDPDP